MAMPKRTSVADFYAQLADHARPHLLTLRRLCQEGLPDAEEVLHWNQPAFVQDGTRLVLLQSFTAHCSLRFPTHQFAAQRDRVEAAGYEAGAGFIKLPYDREIPIELCAALIAARREEFEATGSAWTQS
ncbi:MAG TPA: DUF1801 domain-containing protein [Gryllotalpicola sp.]